MDNHADQAMRDAAKWRQLDIQRLHQRRAFMLSAGLYTTATLLGIAVMAPSSQKSELLKRQVRADGRLRIPPGQVAVEPTDVRVELPPSASEEADAARATPTHVDTRVRATHTPRLPPGQETLPTLRPMGGRQGNPSRKAWTLRVHGEVEHELVLSFDDLLAMPQTQVLCDVHCVTTWSMLDSRWDGVQVRKLAEVAGVKSSAKHVIFEAAHGYTANVPLAEALADNVLIAHRFMDQPLALAHGAPVRSLVPDLYFWKSSKWLTGVKFVSRDEPGYWEVRGYHNHGDPWKEERYG